MLHVTNGTSVSLDRSGLGGEILVWRDVLHEGPVPEGLDLDDLTRLRGKFLDSIWPGKADSAIESLAGRDATLGRFAGHDEVTLWFEHDLFDQLQLIQILDWFRARQSGANRLSLICIDDYLGHLTGEQLAELWPARHAVTVEEMNLAAVAWSAFRAPDPSAIEEVMRQDTSALPFLAGALRRHLQQFPSVENGLSRTERQIMELVEAGVHRLPELFCADRQREERIFMGDDTFERHVRGLGECRHPLLIDEHGYYTLTPTGRDVLATYVDHVRLNGINRWLGGVHLEGNEARWRWDERRSTLLPH